MEENKEQYKEKRGDVISIDKKTIPIWEKGLLSVEDMMAYTGWGENTVRGELNHPKCYYVVRKGNRLYANKKLLDKYLDSISGI